MYIVAAKRRQLNRITFKLSNVVVNAKAIMQAVAELDPLAVMMPSDSDDRHQYVQYICQLKSVINTAVYCSLLNQLFDFSQFVNVIFTEHLVD